MVRPRSDRERSGQRRQGDGSGCLVDCCWRCSWHRDRLWCRCCGRPERARHHVGPGDGGRHGRGRGRGRRRSRCPRHSSRCSGCCSDEHRAAGRPSALGEQSCRPSRWPSQFRGRRCRRNRGRGRRGQRCRLDRRTKWGGIYLRPCRHWGDRRGRDGGRIGHRPRRTSYCRRWAGIRCLPSGPSSSWQ